MNFPHQTLETSELEKIGWHSLVRMVDTQMDCRITGGMARKDFGKISAKGGDARLQDTRCKIKKWLILLRFVGFQWVALGSRVVFGELWTGGSRDWGVGYFGRKI